MTITLRLSRAVLIYAETRHKPITVLTRTCNVLRIIASRPRHAGTKLTALHTALKIMMPTIQAVVPTVPMVTTTVQTVSMRTAKSGRHAGINSTTAHALKITIRPIQAIVSTVLVVTTTVPTVPMRTAKSGCHAGINSTTAHALKITIRPIQAIVSTVLKTHKLQLALTIALRRLDGSPPISKGVG